MGFVYVFYSSTHPHLNSNLVKIGYSENWEHSLVEVNSDSLDTFFAYAVYESDDILLADKIMSHIDEINPNLRFKKEDGTITNYFVADKQKIFDLLKSYASLNSGGPQPHLVNGDEFFTESDDSGDNDISSIRNVNVTKIEKLSKSTLKNLVIFHKIKINVDNCTRASVTTPQNHYWANPNVNCLNDNWSIILDDNLNNIAYVFYVEKGKISPSSLQIRKDKPGVFDVRIAYDDDDFTDIPSGVKFGGYLVGSFDYSKDNIADVGKGVSAHKRRKNRSNHEIRTNHKAHENQEEITEQEMSTTLRDITIPYTKDYGTRVKPTSFTLFGSEHIVSSWKTLYGEFIDELYNYNKEKMTSMARRNFYFSDEDDVQITDDPSMVRWNRDPRLITGTNIYYLTNLSAKAITDNLKILCKTFKIDASEVSVKYKLLTKNDIESI